MTKVNKTNISSNKKKNLGKIVCYCYKKNNYYFIKFFKYNLKN